MTTTELKSNLHQLIDNINDSTVLNAVYALLSKMSFKKENVDGWELLSAEQKAEIEAAIKELDNGEGVSHENVMAKYKGKYL